MTTANLHQILKVLAPFSLPLTISAQASAAGFVDQNNNPVPEVTLASQYTEYRCPFGTGFGTIITEEFQFTGYFQASRGPGPNLRVRLENVTPEFSDTPYTDRAYDKGTHSEKIKFAADSKHRSKTFSVFSVESEEAPNQFEYQQRR